MKRNVDLVGQKFGKLTVLSVAFIKKHKFYNCKCECGNEKVVRGSSLVEGKTKSCGCVLRQRQKEHGASKRIIYKAFGNEYTIEEIEQKFKMHRNTFYRRIKSGMSIEEALITPVGYRFEREKW